MCSANCLTGSATARTSRDSFPEPGQRKTKSLPSSTNQVRLEPTSYNLELVGPNSNILCSNQYGIYRMLTPEPGQRKTKSLPSSTNQVRLEPTLYKLGLVGPNSNILCQINTVFTGCLQLKIASRNNWAFIFSNIVLYSDLITRTNSPITL